MTPKEDQQPMTTREELVACRKQRMDQIDYSVDLQRIIEDLCRNRSIREPQTGARHHYEMAVAYRLASRQEVSVEAIAREFRSAMLDTPTDGGFNARTTERERIADEYARALIAEYSITKRTTEG